MSTFGGVPICVAEPLGRLRVDHPRLAQQVDLVRSEAEVLERVEQPSDAGEDPVAAPWWEPPREDLEDRRLLRRTRRESCLQHRQLVVVGQQCGAGHAGTVRKRTGAEWTA